MLLPFLIKHNAAFLFGHIFMGFEIVYFKNLPFASIEYKMKDFLQTTAIKRVLKAKPMGVSKVR